MALRAPIYHQSRYLSKIRPYGGWVLLEEQLPPNLLPASMGRGGAASHTLAVPRISVERMGGLESHRVVCIRLNA
jgi:hypothetical protein